MQIKLVKPGRTFVTVSNKRITSEEVEETLYHCLGVSLSLKELLDLRPGEAIAVMRTEEPNEFSEEFSDWCSTGDSKSFDIDWVVDSLIVLGILEPGIVRIDMVEDEEEEEEE